MSKISIVLEDTPEGLVAVETTIQDFDLNSNAQRMADRVNSYIAHIAQQKKPMDEPKHKPSPILLS